MNNKKDKNRTERPEVLALVEQLLTSGDVRSAHYCGYAHEPLLRLLHRHLGTGFTVMDLWDRYGIEACWWWDEEDYGMPCPGDRRPDWLEGVSFYFEGCPGGDLHIYDGPWYAEYLASLVERRSPQPIYVVLAEEAVTCAGHADYIWADLKFCTLGTRKRHLPRRTESDRAK
jgi:hypothetical protein